MVESLWFFTYKIISSAKRSFNLFLSNFHAFFFSCLIALTRTSRVMLNRNMRVVTLVLIPTLEEQLPNFLHWAWALGFHVWYLLCWGIFFPQFVESFIMKEYWNLSNVPFFIFYFHDCDLSYLLICVSWTILTSSERIPFDHGAWYFQCTTEFWLLIKKKNDVNPKNVT